MIKFLKSLFTKKTSEIKTEEVIVPKTHKFIPETEIEEHLVSEGFINEGSLLIKRLESSEVSYNIDTGILMISKKGGNISLTPEGDLFRVKRFLKKYII